MDATARRAVEFLQREDAFAGYHAVGGRSWSPTRPAIATVAEAGTGRRAARPSRPTGCRWSPRWSAGSTSPTPPSGSAILERIGEVLGGVNRARATLDARRRELAAVEGRAEFAAEFALLGQAITGGAGRRGHPGALRRAARQADAAGRDAGVPVRRVRRLPGPARRQAHRGLRGVRRRASRRCSTSGPGGPTGWSTRPSASSASVQRRVAGAGHARRGQHLLRHRSDGRRSCGRSPTSCVRSATPVRAEELDGPGQGRPPGGRPGPARPARPLRRRRQHDPARPAHVRGEHPGHRPDAGAARRRRAGLRDHRHRLPRAGARRGVRRPTRPFWDQPLVSEYAGRSTGPSTWPPRCSPTTRPGAAAAGRWRRCATLVRRAAEARYDEGYERGVHDADAAADPRRAAAAARRRRACCATRRRSGPRRSCSGRSAPTPRPAGGLDAGGPRRWPGPGTCSAPAARSPSCAPSWRRRRDVPRPAPGCRRPSRIARRVPGRGAGRRHRPGS